MASPHRPIRAPSKKLPAVSPDVAIPGTPSGKSPAVSKSGRRPIVAPPKKPGTPSQKMPAVNPVPGSPPQQVAPGHPVPLKGTSQKRPIRPPSGRQVALSPPAPILADDFGMVPQTLQGGFALTPQSPNVPMMAPQVGMPVLPLTPSPATAPVMAMPLMGFLKGKPIAAPLMSPPARPVVVKPPPQRMAPQPPPPVVKPPVQQEAPLSLEEEPAAPQLDFSAATPVLIEPMASPGLSLDFSAAPEVSVPPPLGEPTGADQVKTRRLPKVQEPSAAEDIPQPALPRKGSVRTLARRETAVMPTVKTGASSRLTAVKKEKPTLASRESGRNIASGLLEDAMDMDKKTSQRSGSVSGRISQKVSATKVSGSGKSIMEAISARRSSVKIQVWYSNPKTLTLVAGCVILILAVAVGIVAFVPKKTFPPAPSEPKNARKNPSGTPSKPVAGKVSEASSSQAETASSSSDPSLDGIPEEMRGRPGLH